MSHRVCHGDIYAAFSTPGFSTSPARADNPTGASRLNPAIFPRRRSFGPRLGNAEPLDRIRLSESPEPDLPLDGR